MPPLVAKAGGAKNLHYLCKGKMNIVGPVM